MVYLVVLNLCGGDFGAPDIHCGIYFHPWHFLLLKGVWHHHQPFFDGAWLAAGWGRVKAAHSAPAGLGLDPGTDQARLHQ